MSATIHAVTHEYLGIQNLTEKEVAIFLHCSVAALRRWRRENRGPRFFKIGRLVRYDLKSLHEFCEANASGPEHKPAVGFRDRERVNGGGR